MDRHRRRRSGGHLEIGRSSERCIALDRPRRQRDGVAPAGGNAADRPADGGRTAGVDSAGLGETIARDGVRDGIQRHPRSRRQIETDRTSRFDITVAERFSRASPERPARGERQPDERNLAESRDQSRSTVAISHRSILSLERVRTPVRGRWTLMTGFDDHGVASL